LHLSQVVLCTEAELPSYGSAGTLSEMFNFPPPQEAAVTVNNTSESPIQPSYRIMLRRHAQAPEAEESEEIPHNNHQFLSIHDSANAANSMQLSHTNSQVKSSPPPNSSLHHLLLQHSSNSRVQGFRLDHGSSSSTSRAEHLGLSLSSSLQQQFDGVKVEELSKGDNRILNFHHQAQFGGYSSNSHALRSAQASTNYQLQPLFNEGIIDQSGQFHVGYGSLAGGAAENGNVLRNSKYAKAARELLEEFCSVGRGQVENRTSSNVNPNANNHGGVVGGVGSGSGVTEQSSPSSSKGHPPLSAADKAEYQRRKVEARYSHYCEQMQMVVTSFDSVMGYGAATPYMMLARRAMSQHFRSLKDGIASQIKLTCEMLGEKDASGGGGGGLTIGETPRLKLLEQSFRQQKAFQQMALFEPEAWRYQRGLPERSVSNWFINARVRLWKPLVEEIYQQEAKEEAKDPDQLSETAAKINQKEDGEGKTIQIQIQIQSDRNRDGISAQTPTPRSQINALDSDPSLNTINTTSLHTINTISTVSQSNNFSGIQSFPITHFDSAPLHDRVVDLDAACHRGEIVDVRFGTPVLNRTRFGAPSANDVSLTLGLRHAGNLPERAGFF
ncbi:POX domain, partial [Dillenia turbinata]